MEMNVPSASYMYMREAGNDKLELCEMFLPCYFKRMKPKILSFAFVKSGRMPLI